MDNPPDLVSAAATTTPPPTTEPPPPPQPPITLTINTPTTNPLFNSTDTKITLSPDEFLTENGVKFLPSSIKDFDVLRNVRRVVVRRGEEENYTITTDAGHPLFTTSQLQPPPTFSNCFKNREKVTLLKDSKEKALLKLDFGRSGTFSTTLRFSAITAFYRSKQEEPVGVVFKDRGCCFYSCCSTEVNYESVAQMEGGGVVGCSVKSKGSGGGRSRGEFMVKHGDGSILAFIDKEKKVYTLTMGENLKPMMKANLVGFVIAMDTMDAADSSRLSCYLRPSTYVTILFLFLLFFMIGAFLFHFITAMILAWPKKSIKSGCNDEIHVVQDDPWFNSSGSGSAGYFNGSWVRD